MPNLLAATRWPASCTVIEMSSAAIKMIQPSSRLMRQPFPHSMARLCQDPTELARPRASPGICGEYLINGGHVPACAIVFRHYLRHGVDYAGEGDLPRKESGDTLLVGGVVYGRHGTGGAAGGTREGQPRARAMGIRMSGGLACASVDPSVNSTMECTTDCGCTTTSIRSKPMPNNRWASMISRPLFTRVAQLTVMTGPIFQVGWASACS